MTLLAATDAFNVYEQFLGTGVVGAVAVLFIIMWRQALKREGEKEKEWADRFEALWKEREAAAKLHAEELQKLAQRFHDEIKSLTDEILDTIKEQLTAETKRDEVLRQVVTVQGSVERTLDRFLQRYRITGAHYPSVSELTRGGKRGL